jgi:hypothetical protein
MRFLEGTVFSKGFFNSLGLKGRVFFSTFADFKIW